MLYGCKYNLYVWTKIEQYIKSTFDINIKFRYQDIVFGIDVKCVEDQIIVVIVMETKWQIWKQRNRAKYGKNNYVGKELMFDIVKSALCLNAQNVLNCGLLNDEMKRLVMKFCS